MTPPLPDDVRSLFKPPFVTDKARVEATGHEFCLPYAVFVHDANGWMAASRVTNGQRRSVVPRGYGRHQYLINGDARHDAWCAWFRKAVEPRAGTDLDEVAKILNDAWKEGTP